jgi:hypothetical protein
MIPTTPWLWEARRFQEADAALRSIWEASAGFMVYEFTLAGKWLEFLRQVAPRVNARGGPSGFGMLPMPTPGRHSHSEGCCVGDNARNPLACLLRLRQT